MLKYTIRRLLLLIPVILGVTIAVFSIMYLVPGDPAVTMLGVDAGEEALNELRHALNLDQPYLVRLGMYMYQVFIQFDLGESYMTGLPILNEILSRFPNTLILAISCIIVAMVAGVSLGVYAATHQGKIGDYISIVVALLGASIPGFWLSLMAVLVFATKLRWLPAYGMGGFQYWILPVLTTSVMGIASQARQSRSSMLEVLGSDYIVMARSKGLSEKKVIFRHALPNALIPIITVAGTNFALLLGGSMLTENIFSIPGVGLYMIKAVNNRDYPSIQGSVLLLAILFSLIMLVMDLIMAAVDPRIKAQFSTPKRNKRKKEVGSRA